MTTLSICTLTDRAPRFIAQALAPFRGIADEIVVAIDHRVMPSDLAPLAGIADHVVPFAYQPPLEVNLEALTGLCRGEWVLRVDGDETPSDALVERLADRSWADGVTHVYLARHWLWPDPGSVLDEHPWRNDPQLRLLRNVPGLVDHPRLPHELPTVRGPGRFLAEGLYHLDLLLGTEAERRAKVRRYERARPGMRTEDGRPQNLGFYVPEARSSAPRTRPVPVADRSRLHDLVAGTDRRSRRRGLPSPAVGALTGPNRPAPSPPAPGEATIAIVDPGPRDWVRNTDTTVTVEIRNASADTWDPSDPNPVRAGAHLHDATGAVRLAELRADLPCRVRPGRSELVRLTVPGVPAVGPHRLHVGVLREGLAWFDTGADLEVEIVRRPRIVIGSGITGHRHFGDDVILRAAIEALTEAFPRAEIVLLSDDPDDASRRFSETSVYGANPIIHADGPTSDRELARKRIDAFVADAERLAGGESVGSDHHRDLLHTLADTDALVLLGADWATSAYWQGLLHSHAAEAAAAHRLGVPVHFEAGTIGPVDERDAPVLSLLLTACDRVSVRDGSASIDTARRHGVAEPALHEAVDVATAAAPADRAELDAFLGSQSVSGPWAVVSVRDRHDIASAHDTEVTAGLLEAAITRAHERGLTPILVPHVITNDGDDDRSEGARLAVSSPLRTDVEMPSDPTVVALIAGADLTIGNRFHLGMIAAAHGTPGILLATSPFDAQRATCLEGSSVAVLPAEREADPVRLVDDLLDRGRREPIRPWNPEPLVGALAASIPRG